MHNRLGQLTMPLEEGKVYFGTGSDCQFTFDAETRERRPSVAEDVRRFAQLCDGLDQIDFVMSMGTPSDVPAMDHYVHSFIQMIRGTAKPNVYTAQNHQDMEDIYQIRAARSPAARRNCAKNPSCCSTLNRSRRCCSTRNRSAT